MQNYNKVRAYDGVNSDMSFQLTFVGLKKKKIKRMKYSKNVVIDKYLLMDDCTRFYKEREKNYSQMISDFTYFNIKKVVDTTYYPPLIIKKDDSIIFCHVKIDEINNLRFVKFNFTTLSNEMCFHDYMGDIDNYLCNEITLSNGYLFYINNKRVKFDNLRKVINYYLKKSKTKDLFYSLDNIVALTDNFERVATKYLKRTYLKKNLYIRNINEPKKNLMNLNGVYLSEYGNFVYVVQSCNNPCEEYEKLIPALENSYDLLKEYILMNEYLSEKFKNYQTYSIKTKTLKNDLKELCFFEFLKHGLLKKSMGSVGLIVKEFERTCYDINFNKKLNRMKKFLIEELKRRNVSLKEFVSLTTAKTIGEVYDKTLDRFE